MNELWAWDKYGEQAFLFEPVEERPPGQLQEGKFGATTWTEAGSNALRKHIQEQIAGETSIEKESIWIPRPKTPRGLQVTCRGCRAYGFPHRLGGGRCTGDEWAESYYLFERELCETCNCNHNGQYGVATGQEHIRECEGYQEHLRMQCPPTHPTNEEELARQLEEEYNDRYSCT